MTKRPTSGGGWHAIGYTLRMARKAGFWRLWTAMRSKNACKTCALGMGGQQGGMRNEAGHWPEVCKKSLQAMVADMQGGIRAEFFARYPLGALRSLSPRELESAGRIVQPLHAEAGSDRYRVIDWPEALERVAGALRSTRPDRSFFYFSGRSSNEAAFLLQLFARLHGTNNVNNCSYYCHQASGVGLTGALGTGTATVALEDVENADLFVLIGGNPASNHPRLMRSLMTVRRNGGQVVVVNPVIETGLVNFRVPSDVKSLFFGTAIASQYLQPHIGGDIALLLGVAKRVLEEGAIDRAFLDEATVGFAAFAEWARTTSWDRIESASGVARGEIEVFARTYAAAKRVVFGWTMGITHHAHGVDNVRMIANLALLRGMVGKPGAGVLPIRGHSNVQGIGSMGVSPALKQALFERLESHFNVRLPTSAGLDTMASIRAAERGEIDFGLCLGGNLFGSNPDAAMTRRALARIKTLVYLSTTLNTGHAHGLGRETLVLPVLARDEEAQSTTQESMFNYVRLSDGGPPRHPGPRSEVDIIASIAAKVLGTRGPIDWESMRQHATIRAAIGKIVPGYERIGAIDRTKEEFDVAGRILHARRFPTPDGKARFHVCPIPVGRPAGAGERNALRLMTVRSEGQFNTVVYEEADLYRGQERRDVILMNEEDMKRLGLETDQPVVVTSGTGQMRGLLARPYSIRAGNALMYYPEANILVPADLDPDSRTPAFKSIPITVEADTHSPAPPFLVPAEALVGAANGGPRRETKAC